MVINRHPIFSSGGQRWNLPYMKKETNLKSNHAHFLQVGLLSLNIFYKLLFVDFGDEAMNNV